MENLNTKSLKENILDFKKLGYSHNKISQLLSCSKSTVSYHTNANVRKCSYEQHKNIPIIEKKLFRFKESRSLQGALNKSLSDKIGAFCVPRDKTKSIRCVTKSYKDFSAKELLDINNPICYLTGRSLDLNNAKSYSLDHKIPRSKGGSNTLDNCGLTCKEANMAKSDLLLNDFFQLCIDVVKHNNLDIS